MTKDSIALIGFMATGKTSIGQALADNLGNEYRFIETDQIIIEDAGKLIPRIFAEDGEIRFREYEIEACKKASQLYKVVISCGGGIVLNKINIDYLKQNSHIVLLQASAEEIYKRAMKDGQETRPIIDKEDPTTRKGNYFINGRLYIDCNTIEDIVGKDAESLIDNYIYPPLI